MVPGAGAARPDKQPVAAEKLTLPVVAGRPYKEQTCKYDLSDGLV